MATFEIHTLTGSHVGSNLLITAGIHGDEYEGVEAIRQLINHVDTGTLRGSLTLVPIVNVSAYERASRVGTDGLDLARTFPGSANGSITERVAHELAGLLAETDAYIDLHSGGKLLRVSPLVGYMLVKNVEVLKRQRAMARAFGLPIVWGTTADLDGRSLSAAREVRVPAIYAEYLGGGECSSAGVVAYIEGCLNVMASLGMVDRGTTSTIANRDTPLVIEDPRPGSGHLQVHHPSPIDGAVEFVVTLGDEVVAGQVLGHVSSESPESGDVTEPIVAGSTGRVICLHAAPRVAIGDCMAVVLDCGKD